MIRVRDLKHKALDIPSFESSSSRVAIIGPNGAGKTTFLELLSGMEVPESGNIMIGDVDPGSSIVGWVGEFPDRTMLFSTVRDEVSSSLRFRKVPASEADEKTRESLSRLDCLHLLNRKVQGLSGGEKSLVAFAAASTDDPDLMILDETDSHLDEATADMLWKDIMKMECQVVFSTQDMDRASQADEVIFLEGGRILLSGTPEDVFVQLTESCYYPPAWRLGI